MQIITHAGGKNLPRETMHLILEHRAFEQEFISLDCALGPVRNMLDASTEHAGRLNCFVHPDHYRAGLALEAVEGGDCHIHNVELLFNLVRVLLHDLDCQGSESLPDFLDLISSVRSIRRKDVVELVGQIELMLHLISS